MENKKVIEINGVKLEVDLSTARVIDEYKVGDNVKVLKKRYDSYDVSSGVIVEFVNFKELPTIQVAIFKSDYNGCNIEIINFNSETKDVEIVPCGEHDLVLERTSVLDQFEFKINKLRNEIADLEYKRDWFVENYAKHFKKEEINEERSVTL